jgi:hypothetical protein
MNSCHGKKGVAMLSRHFLPHTLKFSVAIFVALGIVAVSVMLLPSFHALAQGQPASPPSAVLDPKHARPIAGYHIVTSTTSEAVQPGAQFGWNAECPSPKVVLGGGYFAGDAFNPEPELLVIASAPSVNFEGFYDGKFWHVEVKNTGPNASFFTVYAVCALAAR